MGEGGKKYVYSFGGGQADGRGSMVNLLGGKGANLAEMAHLAFPIPPGFTITTEVCLAYYAADGVLPPDVKAQVDEALLSLEEMVGSKFGDPDNPLLVSVRSGARASMPGMMDTILNIGLNDQSVRGLAKVSDDERFAYDSYRRFIQMYADVVMGVDHGVFEDFLGGYKNLNGLELDTDLSADDWREIIGQYKQEIEREAGAPFPQNSQDQLWGAINAVFGSWQNTRAITYRRMHGIPDDWGTAVTVQSMVFGNRGETSATGVAFTRNPSTGANEVYGEYLINAQGEDVVSGVRTPQQLTRVGDVGNASDGRSLEEVMPQAFGELTDIFERLERHFRDMQDIEFTIQEDRLWVLQTRAGKRSAEAALKIAIDMANEGLITRDEAIMRVDAEGLGQLLHPKVDPGAPTTVIATGLPASPGAAVGKIVFDPDDAESMRAKGEDVILCRVETSPEDIHGMHAAAGILTARGGTTSHAAVVARGMGRPCVSGAGTLRIDLVAGTMRSGGYELKRGDVITIDGSTGRVMKGAVKLKRPALSGAFGTLIGWADDVRRLGVRANADTKREAKLALEFGAEGIGLCRSEHMFFDADRILAVREMICARDEEGRRRALEKILPMQRDDFVELFQTMGGLPVTIRLLDPPLHEFLPREEEEIGSVAEALGISVSELKVRVAELAEFNPMLGMRGCRLAIQYPEIPHMQARAIFEAVILVEKETGKPVTPEIMIPLVASRREFDAVANVIRQVAEEIETSNGTKLNFAIGTMIELPRAALVGDKIAANEEGAEFFSFGTNDLTQTSLGLSRDDAAPILEVYDRNGIFSQDPFASIDEDGVGQLVELGTRLGRDARPELKVGVCGEHGGDPASIAFFERMGLDYVSCSPFRVPVARLAAAQAQIAGADVKTVVGNTD